MERLNLRQLEIFSAVVDAGSFTAAAEKLYLAQSTVSDNVRALEELLHLKLFHRESKRRLTLTLEGKRVYRYAQDILGRCSALLLDVAVDSALELTLGASTVPAQSLLPGYMARFARENPACRCTLLCGDSAAVQQMLLNGDIHLGFVGSADDRQDLIYEPIAEDRLVLITPNTPRFAALKTQGVLGRELFREPFLFRERGSGTQKVIDNYLSEIRLDPQVIHTVAYVSDPTVLQRLVAEGTGVSILSALAVQETVAAGQLLQFELDETPVRRSIYMARRRKSSMSSPARTFAELVRKQAKASVSLYHFTTERRQTAMDQNRELRLTQMTSAAG